MCRSRTRYELRQGLEDRGVPVEMIVYKGFGHGITKPRAQRAVMQHNLSLFNHYLWGDPGFARKGQDVRADSGRLVGIGATTGRKTSGRHIACGSKQFELAVYPVTCEQHEAFLGATASRTAPRLPQFASAPDAPVVGVSWLDCEAYCRGARPAVSPCACRPRRSGNAQHAAALRVRFPWGDDIPAWIPKVA